MSHPIDMAASSDSGQAGRERLLVLLAFATFVVFFQAYAIAPMLPELLAQIPRSSAIASVTGDGAYDTKACHAAIAAIGAAAIIPTRRNAKLWKKFPPGAHARNEILKATQRLGRTIWKKWSGYHRRSLVETKMRCLKLLGERIMSRDFDRQVAELQIRAALLNRFTHLGTPVTVPPA